MPVSREISTCSDAGSITPALGPPGRADDPSLGGTLRSSAGCMSVTSPLRSTRRPPRRVRTQVPSAAGAAVQPVGHPHRAVGLDRDGRADDALPSGYRRELGGVERRDATRPGPQRDDLDRDPGSRVAVPPRMLRRERIDGRDGQLVALARVPAVEEGLDVDRLTREPVERGDVAGEVGARAGPTPRGRRDRPTTARARAGAAPTRARPPTARPRGGTSTARIPSASATAHAWSGPAPPKATSARSRASTPRSTVTTRTARSMLASTTCTIPSAVSPARSIARRAPSTSRRPRPGSAVPSGMRPRTRSASVTVGSVPPRP